MSKSCVILVDRSGLFRAAVRRALSREADIEVAGEARSADEALGLLEDSTPNVALVDADLPDSLHLARQVRRRSPKVSVILVTENEGVDGLFRALKVGAAACISRDTSGRDLAAVINKVAQGRYPITEGLFHPQVAALVLQELEIGKAIEGESPRDVLSARQAEILKEVLKPKSSQQVAEALGTDIQTVQEELALITQKLGTHDPAHDAALLPSFDPAPGAGAAESNPCPETWPFLLEHLLLALRAGIAEIEGLERLARRWRAETRLRLLAMSPEEVWELACLTYPGSPADRAYEAIQQAVSEHATTAMEWFQDLSSIKEDYSG